MPHILMKGRKELRLAMPNLQDGPYTAIPNQTFEVSSRDAKELLTVENDRLFELVGTPVVLDIPSEAPESPVMEEVKPKRVTRRKKAE